LHYLLVSVVSAASLLSSGCRDQSATNSVTGVTSEVYAQQYAQQCASCHADNATGNEALQAPALAGQLGSYIERQLYNFKHDIRYTDVPDPATAAMVAAAKQLDTVHAAGLAQWLERLPPPQAQSASEPVSNLKRGEKTYQAYCSSCHGYRAEGNPQLHAPRLAGLKAASLARQYAHFVAGRRGSHTQDRHGRTMAAIATGLRDQALVNDVLAYIGTL